MRHRRYEERSTRDPARPACLFYVTDVSAKCFPTKSRGAALAISGATNWVANFTVTVSFLPPLKAVGLTGAYAFYAIAAAISLPFV
jgi:hypothetical protein